ncbi:MAG: MinD/ParA family protein [Methylococcaceae bacterium]
MHQSKPIKVIAITSGKGGVGKTNISANLSIALSQLGRKVVVLDADMGLANIDVLLGIHPQYNLSHVLQSEKSLDEIIVDGPGGIKIIPGASGIQQMSELSSIEQASIIRAFSEIRQEIDIMIVDTAAGISSGVVNLTRACQEVMVVVCDEPTSLTDAYASIKLLNRDYGLYKFQVISNMVKDQQQGQMLFSKLCKVTDHYLDVALNYVGAVPYDESLRKAVQKQIAVLDAYPSSKSSLALKNIARKVNALPATTETMGGLAFFIERMVQANSREDAA